MLKQKKTLVAVVLLILAAIMALTGVGVYAKYVKRVTLKGKVTFSAQLATDVKLIEHVAERSKSGEYTLTDVETSTNSYTLMPGVDIPKDPAIVIEGKTGVKAYLYIEILGSQPSDTVTYEMQSCWLALLDKNGDSVTGKNGGKVYVYCENGGDATQIDDKNCPNAPIYILKDNMVYVSDSYDETAQGGFSIDIYGYMIQALSDDAVTAFNEFT